MLTVIELISNSEAADVPEYRQPKASPSKVRSVALFVVPFSLHNTEPPVPAPLNNVLLTARLLAPVRVIRYSDV